MLSCEWLQDETLVFGVVGSRAEHGNERTDDEKDESGGNRGVEHGGGRLQAGEGDDCISMAVKSAWNHGSFGAGARTEAVARGYGRTMTPIVTG